MAKSYTKTFFVKQQDGSTRSAEHIVPLVVDWLRLESAVDVGCGVGTWTDVLLSHGLDAMGVDGEWVDRQDLRIPDGRFISCNLETLSARDLGRRFSLAVCLEVAEHLSPDRAEGFVGTLTELAPAVLFSAAIPGQGGTNHVHERWQSYWARLFAARGFVAIDAIRPRVRNVPGVDWWYRQNTILYVQPSVASSLPDAVRVMEATPEELDMVDPTCYRAAVLSRWRMAKNFVSPPRFMRR